MKIATIISLFLVTLISFGCYSANIEKAEKKSNKEKLRKQPVYVEKIKTGDISHYLYSSGTVKAVEAVDLFPKISGYVAEVYKEKGDPVKEKDPLMKLEDQEWKLGVAGVQMEILTLAQKEKQGKLSILSLKKQIEQAELNIEELGNQTRQIELGLKQAKKEMDRRAESYNKRLISAEDYDLSKYNYEKQNLEKSTTLMQIRKATIAKEDLQLTLQRTKLDLQAIIIEQKKSMEVALRHAQLNLNHATLRAPFAGVIIDKSVTPGQLVGPGNKVFSLVSLKKLELELNIPEKDLPLLKLKQKVILRSENFSSLNATGEIKTISPVIDSASGTVQIVVSLNNKNQLLRPGIFVQASIELQHRSSVTLIPRSSIIYEQDRKMVYTVKGKKVHSRFIKTGITQVEMVEILEGVEPDDLLVVGGHHLLQDKQAVQVLKQEKSKE